MPAPPTKTPPTACGRCAQRRGASSQLIPCWHAGRVNGANTAIPSRLTGVPPAGTTKRVGGRRPSPHRKQQSRRVRNYTFSLLVRVASHGSPPGPLAHWSRPVPADGCSMLARMPRYVPAASGIRSPPRIPATGRNGSSRHMLPLLDSRLLRRIECRSGLLIRGFGVQVPGGAPGLTWGFITPGHFCAPGLPGFRGRARSLLARRSDVDGGSARPGLAD